MNDVTPTHGRIPRKLIILGPQSATCHLVIGFNSEKLAWQLNFGNGVLNPICVHGKLVAEQKLQPTGEFVFYHSFEQ